MKYKHFIAIILPIFIMCSLTWIVFAKYSFDYIIIVDLKKNNSGKCKIGLKMTLKDVIKDVDKDHLCNMMINKIFEKYQIRINSFSKTNAIYKFDDENGSYEITFNFQNINNLNTILQSIFPNDDKIPAIQCIHKKSNIYSFLFTLPSQSTRMIQERDLLNKPSVRSFNLKIFSSRTIKYIFKCHFYETINKISDKKIFVDESRKNIHIILPFYDENLVNKMICKTVELKSPI